MRTNQVFCLDNSLETEAVAESLAVVCSGFKDHHRKFNTTDCFSKLTNPETFVFIGVPNSEYTHLFAFDFEKRFIKKFTHSQKHLVKDIYLFINVKENHQSTNAVFAQNVANKLSERGFHYVTIHTVVPPQELNNTLQLSITLGDPSIGHRRLLAKRKDEILSAHYVSRDDNQPHYFIENENPLDALDMPQYVFIPFEEKEVRRDRIRLHAMQARADRECQLRDEASDQIKLYADEYLTNAVLKQRLMRLANDIQHHAYNAWRPLIAKERAALKNEGLIKRKSDISVFLHDMEDIKKKSIPHGKIGRLMQVETLTEAFQAKARMKNMLQQLEDERDELAHQLVKEIKQLQNCCFPFFNQYEIETKGQKLFALKTLNFNKSLAALQLEVKERVTNERVMRHLKTSRTQDLFNKILHAEEYVAAMPTKKLGKS